MELTAKMPIIASIGKVAYSISSIGSTVITRDETEVFKLPIYIGEFLFGFCYFHVPIYCADSFNNALGSIETVKELKYNADAATLERFYAFATRRGLIKKQSFVYSEAVELFQKQYNTSHSTRTISIKAAGKLVAKTLGSEVPHYAT